MFGLRLRVKGESQQANVHALIDTLPYITTSEEKIRLIFDRGYGKMDFIEENARKRYNISTIATTLGSRHPFVTKKESDKYIQDCLDFNLVPTFVKISDKNQTQLELSRGEVFRLQKKNSKKN